MLTQELGISIYTQTCHDPGISPGSLNYACIPGTVSDRLTTWER